MQLDAGWCTVGTQYFRLTCNSYAAPKLLVKKIPGARTVFGGSDFSLLECIAGYDECCAAFRSKNELYRCRGVAYELPLHHCDPQRIVGCDARW